MSPGTNDEKVARALDPQEAYDDVRRRFIEAQATALQCRKEQSNRVAHVDVEQSSCAANLPDLTDQTVYVGEAKAYLGGRLHISIVGNPNQLVEGCGFYVGTDLGESELRALRFAASVTLKTSVGEYRVIPKGRTTFPFDRGCIFDIVRVPIPR